jgi:DNA-binding response OmpR family regulator
MNTTDKHKILLVEDDINFGSVLKAYLELFEFETQWVTDGQSTMQLLGNAKFDLCVLDVMLPHADGFSIAERIRKLTPQTPFIFLTAKTLKKDILRGYDTGADDYITKPFDSEVLLRKIRAILQRTATINLHSCKDQIFTIGNYRFDYAVRDLSIGKESRLLSPHEADLLRLLCERMNEILPRDLALKTIWGEESYFTTRSMDVYVTKLRKYLKKDPNIKIMNIHGNGFRLIST